MTLYYVMPYHMIAWHNYSKIQYIVSCYVKLYHIMVENDISHYVTLYCNYEIMLICVLLDYSTHVSGQSPVP